MQVVKILMTTHLQVVKSCLGACQRGYKSCRPSTVVIVETCLLQLIGVRTTSTAGVLAGSRAVHDDGRERLHYMGKCTGYLKPY